MTLREVAALLRVHPVTVRRMIERGEIPSFRVGSDFRFSRETIEAWRRAQEQPATPPSRTKARARS